MGLFKSEDEKAQEAAARAEQERREAESQVLAQQAERERAWLATPLGQAQAALERGERFCELQLVVGRQEREAMWGARDYATSDVVISSAQVLGQVEEMGWRLEHVGYVFRMTGESSSQKAFASGLQTSVSGDTVGVYLFRNTTVEPAAAAE